MRARSLFLLVLLYACSKNDRTTPAATAVALNDSVWVMGASAYQADLDGDHINDIRIRWNNNIGQTSASYRFYAMPLNNDTHIHAVSNTQPVCRDSVMLGAYLVPKIYDCTGGPKQLRIDTFTVTPNISNDLLQASTMRQMPGDSFLVYESSQLYPLPSPYAQLQSMAHGFFRDSMSGNLLVSVKGKRIALAMRLQIPYLHFDRITRID